jgi:hypothetical protein
MAVPFKGLYNHGVGVVRGDVMSKLGEGDRRAFVIRPRVPAIDGIFDLTAETLIASHQPHDHIEEHLHDHLPHMHIRYGFEIPSQSLDGIDGLAPWVMMAIKVDHRVDCNPIFVARGSGAEGVCLKIAGQDVHWVYDDSVAKRGAGLFEATGRRLPEGFYWAGFSTSDLSERHLERYPALELKRAIGFGLRADQHFQATWREPREEPIEPYDVIIGLGDDVTNYHTFFRLSAVPPLGVG